MENVTRETARAVSGRMVPGAVDRPASRLKLPVWTYRFRLRRFCCRRFKAAGEFGVGHAVTSVQSIPGMKLSSPLNPAMDSTSSSIAPSTSRRSQISTGECM